MSLAHPVDQFAGPAPEPETANFVVPDLHCAGCMAKVERKLAGASGISSARVNLSARQVRVTWDRTALERR